MFRNVTGFRALYTPVLFVYVAMSVNWPRGLFEAHCLLDGSIFLFANYASEIARQNVHKARCVQLPGIDRPYVEVSVRTIRADRARGGICCSGVEPDLPRGDSPRLPPDGNTASRPRVPIKSPPEVIVCPVCMFPLFPQMDKRFFKVGRY